MARTFDISSYFSPMKHFPMKKKTSADETLSANERLSETSQNLSLAITLSLAVAKTVDMFDSPNLHYSTVVMYCTGSVLTPGFWQKVGVSKRVTKGGIFKGGIYGGIISCQKK